MTIFDTNEYNRNCFFVNMSATTQKLKEPKIINQVIIEMTTKSDWNWFNPSFELNARKPALLKAETEWNKACQIAWSRGKTNIGLAQKEPLGFHRHI